MTKRITIAMGLALWASALPLLAAPVAEFVPSPIAPKTASCVFRSGDKGIRVNGTVVYEPTESLPTIQRMASCQVAKFDEAHVFLVAVYQTQSNAGPYPLEQTVLELAVLNKEFNRYQSVFNTVRAASDRDGCKDDAASPPKLSWGHSSTDPATPVVGIPSCDDAAMEYYFYDTVKGFQPF